VKPAEKAVAPLAFDPILFDSGKANLKPPAVEQLKKIAESMKANPQIKLKIEGHTDNVYSDAFNVKLSKQRAEDAMNELVKLGVDAKRLEAAWYGEKQPIADNATEEGKAKNRRVSFKVMSP
jgi:outer membrane protein OmpA-like peptidoglycan-associated protein